jgi:hypothetical protein
MIVDRATYWEHHAAAWEAAGYAEYAASCRARKTGRKGTLREYRID